MENAEDTVQLAKQLNDYKQRFLQKADAKKIHTYEDGIQAVIESGILEKALNVGDSATNFQLKNATGKTVQLSDYLDKNTVVLTWYRGGWCPYCNLTLRSLQLKLPEFQAENAVLLALTPELPDNSLKTSEKHQLEFEVLTDLNNEVAQKYGIVFRLTPEVEVYYNNAFDLEKYNGRDTPELPLSATYVIDKEGIIRYTFLDADYRNRAEPAEVLNAVKQLSAK